MSIINTSLGNSGELIFSDEVSDKPQWKNGCSHEGFIGAIKVIERKPYKEYFVDVYIHEQYKQQHVCIRYGNEIDQYISPGTVIDLIITAARFSRGLPMYTQAAVLIVKLADVKFTFKNVNTIKTHKIEV